MSGFEHFEFRPCVAQQLFLRLMEPENREHLPGHERWLYAQPLSAGWSHALILNVLTALMDFRGPLFVWVALQISSTLLLNGVRTVFLGGKEHKTAKFLINSLDKRAG